MSIRNLRQEVLSVYKQLNKTRLKTFQGDDHALQVTRQKLHDEFRNNKNITDEATIQEKIKFAKEVELEVRTSVIQAVEKAPGTFEARITPDNLVDNAEVGQIISRSQVGQVRKCSDLKKK